MAWFFAFFFVSGCCSLMYEIVWLRLAMAQFGVTTALTSITLSAFMAGLGVGSWASGRFLPKYASRIALSPIYVYAATELLIGTSAFMVPIELAWGHTFLEHTSLTSSSSYYLVSGIWIALTLIPWCALMGATIPIAMVAIRAQGLQDSGRSFSFLYLSNVCGAVLGTIFPLVLIELLGFHGTLGTGAGLNLVLAVSATVLGLTRPVQAGALEGSGRRPAENRQLEISRSPLVLLFSTGLTSMAVEVVWIRQFTPYLGTMVYAFALILAIYLAATFAGSRLYRQWIQTPHPEGKVIWILLGFSIMLSLIAADPGFYVGPFSVTEFIATISGTSVIKSMGQHGPLLLKMLRLFVGIFPFSAILGFATPMLVDRWSGGDPDRAGRAYAVNIIGCIIGPLLSGFALLPIISERWVLFFFAAPWVLIGIVPRRRHHEGSPSSGRWSPKLSYALILLALLVAFTSKGYEDHFFPRVVLRDNTATIVASGKGMDRRLRVNGIGITALDPITKIMAHLALASLDHSPKSALVICFGMGTTYRSLLSWGIPTTAVELVPSVPKVFWFFHSDGSSLLRSPLSHIVIDDGRRYLERTNDYFDVINLDPPPPVGAAGSSLLYSNEFYAAAKRRLRPGGILEQWLPTDETQGDPVVAASVTQALRASFEYVHVFRSFSALSPTRLTQTQGLLFLASDHVIPVRTAESLARRLPETAVHDLLEWGPENNPESQLADILENEILIETVMARAPEATALADDRPVNEYYLLRHLQMTDTWRHLERALGVTKPSGNRHLGTIAP